MQKKKENDWGSKSKYFKLYNRMFKINLNKSDRKINGKINTKPNMKEKLNMLVKKWQNFEKAKSWIINPKTKQKKTTK